MSAPQHALDQNADQAVRTFTHRYPWRREEINIIAFLLVVPALTVTVLHAWGTGTLITVGITTAFAVYLMHLGKSRKDRSALSATLQGTFLKVAKNKSGKGGMSGDLAEMVTVRVNGTHQIDPHLTLETKPNDFDSTRSVRIPMRLARVMAADLAPVLARCTQVGEQTGKYTAEIVQIAAADAKVAETDRQVS